MREIEFRCWHTDIKEYVPVHKYCVLQPNGIFNGDCILEQFTGLRDKNGAKIYEGDIIHLQWIHNYTGSIEFRHGTFCMVSADKEIIVRTLGELYAENISVIGNVHQHPHLLEQKK